MSSPVHSGFAGLIELARRESPEIRPALLRVLTDLYVQARFHTAAERARFAELACRMLDGVDAATRAGIARRLAHHPGTPAVVAARLARDEIAVAEPILCHSPVLSEAELHAILDRSGAAHAVAIGARRDLPPSVARRLRETGLSSRATLADQAAPAAEKDPALTFALARRYLRTGGEERRRILAALPACPPVPGEEALRRLGRAFNERLEQAALRHRTQEFALLLQRNAGIPYAATEAAIADPSGEPMAALCRALGMPFATASRILLFLNPAAGASAQQVFNLAARFEEIDPATARRLVAGWRALDARMKPERAAEPRPAREERAPGRTEPRPAARLTFRGVTPTRPVSAGES